MGRPDLLLATSDSEFLPNGTMFCGPKRGSLNSVELNTVPQISLVDVWAKAPPSSDPWGKVFDISRPELVQLSDKSHRELVKQAIAEFDLAFGGPAPLRETPFPAVHDSSIGAQPPVSASQSLDNRSHQTNELRAVAREIYQALS